ncbi:hypothetical protein PoB_004854300 [Plakobranchus ocellatus]|uniref:Uncharacterized protein n=1 Tax=Plakobranchus ocellatus TaxID=259542 RepID=A0AAV4BS83_9GAST|nr:hypothetical protein PoB_004854300 [Plakobranchus ocellatus]
MRRKERQVNKRKKWIDTRSQRNETQGETENHPFLFFTEANHYTGDLTLLGPHQARCRARTRNKRFLQISGQVNLPLRYHSRRQELQA